MFGWRNWIIVAKTRVKPSHQARSLTQFSCFAFLRACWILGHLTSLNRITGTEQWTVQTAASLLTGLFCQSNYIPQIIQQLLEWNRTVSRWLRSDVPAGKMTEQKDSKSSDNNRVRWLLRSVFTPHLGSSSSHRTSFYSPEWHHDPKLNWASNPPCCPEKKSPLASIHRILIVRTQLIMLPVLECIHSECDSTRRRSDTHCFCPRSSSSSQMLASDSRLRRSSAPIGAPIVLPVDPAFGRPPPKTYLLAEHLRFSSQMLRILN